MSDVINMQRFDGPFEDAGNSGTGTVTFDCRKQRHKVTLTGNCTFALSNQSESRRPVTIRVLQDATGSRTVTWFSGISWAGGTAPTLTTTGSKADVFVFLFTSASTADGFVVGQNI